MDDLPTDYDAIVVGTVVCFNTLYQQGVGKDARGIFMEAYKPVSVFRKSMKDSGYFKNEQGMIESMVAASLSRIGKSVLHLDGNPYYGDCWASFSLDGFENWIKTCNKSNKDKNPNESYSYLVNENETILEIKPDLKIQNASFNYFKIKNDYVEESEIQKEENISKAEDNVDSVIKSKSSCEPQENLQKLSRRFNLDLCPKLLFSKGALVDLLIKSNIARYAEFKTVNLVLTWREGQLEPVPCSRADVFATKNVNVVHKRILVKILTLFANYAKNLNEFKGFENRTFLEYLKHKKLPENLIHYILYAIAMGDNATSCLDGVKNCKRFLESLGRYGNTPFIFPMYGSGELPQCFCRLCAVFGGIYCLQREVEALIVKDDKCTGIISNGKRLNAKNIVLSSKYAPKNYLISENIENISRAIFITDRSILKGEKQSLTLLQFPPVPQVSDKSVTVLELDSGTYTCPENYFIVHMTAKTTEGGSSDFQHVVESLFERENQKGKELKPKVHWSATWTFTKGTSKTSDLCLKNLKICSNIDSELDYDISISEAKCIFKDLYPEEEFLPRAPDPDEIVLDVEESGGENGVEDKPNERYDVSLETTHSEEKLSQPDVATKALKNRNQL